MSVHLKMRTFEADLSLPPGTEILRAREPEPVTDVAAAVREALSTPIGAAPLADLCREVLARRVSGVGAADTAGAPESQAPRPSAAVVVSDSTRPVPYRGEGGILWPLVSFLLEAGFAPESITIVVATGTHRLLSDEEIWAFLDDRVREAGVRVHCHDASDPGKLTWVGRTSGGSEVSMNRRYVEADFKILTGLVEPHLMAGVSGGRKSICPGLVDVQSVRDFHGPVTLAHEKATDLVLDGNPCHAVSLEIGRMAAADFILNVTMRQDGRVAGVFAGDMEKAHLAAVDHLLSFIQIPIEREFDVVVAHAGRVGVNHYQAEKAAAVAAKAARPGGYVVVVADTTDPDPVGTASYRRLMRFLAEVGPEAFVKAIQSDDWGFVHDQWGVQTWTRLLEKIPREHVFYFSPQTALDDYPLLVCADPWRLIGPGLDGAAVPGDETDARSGDSAGKRVARFVKAAVTRACEESRAATGRPATVAYLADGPHGIPARARPA
ncbi:MAG: DUF2088 domain-containing protein [Thermoleophilia bacterium]|nr:DUF2088 domain-containing protein [Thermoleophilia bacterium]